MTELLVNNPNIIISYDGKLGDKQYGKDLPQSLPFKHFYICAGISAQETLSGRTSKTLESLYISENIYDHSKQIESKESIQISLDVA